jgi:hypothetical protein
MTAPRKRSTASVLMTAIKLIEHGWTQRAAARRADGSPCGPADDGAAAWCLTAALYIRDYASDTGPCFAAERCVRAVIGLRDRKDDLDDRGPDGTTTWNDSPERTVKDVLAALREALRRQAPVRHLFVPANYREHTLIGWSDEDGFTPDGGKPVGAREGLLLAVEATNDTPTMPPPKDIT